MPKTGLLESVVLETLSWIWPCFRFDASNSKQNNVSPASWSIFTCENCFDSVIETLLKRQIYTSGEIIPPSWYFFVYTALI